MEIVEETSAQPVAQGYTTTSGNRSKPCGCATSFPDTAHTKTVSTNGESIKMFFHDNASMIDRPGAGLIYKESCFSEDSIEVLMGVVGVGKLIERWDDNYQH